MRIVVGLAGGALVVLMLTEIFLSFLLPRRVKRDPRIVRQLDTFLWRPWRRLARSLPEQSSDTMLGIFGPLALLFDLLMWVLGMMLGFACIQWAGGSHLGAAHVDFGDDMFFSAATMFASGSGGLNPQGTFARFFALADTISGFAVLTIVISYLPSLYQAFSARETTVSQLDPRAGSPPTANRLIVRTIERGGWPRLNDYLHEWETWSAELMETHLSYPTLAYFRSQHVNQNWLSALCTVMDASAFAISAAPKGTVNEARLTYAISRHAVVDLSYTFRVAPLAPAQDRLPPGDFDQLLELVRDTGVELGATRETIGERLTRLRDSYEPYVNALATQLELRLPQWIAPDSPSDNWRTTEWH
jgi:hypothetical protein